MPAFFVIAAKVRGQDGKDQTAAINQAELEKHLPKLPKGTRHSYVMMPLRDNVKLATDVFLPPACEGPWPVMLLRTPYSRFDPRSAGGNYVLGAKSGPLDQRVLKERNVSEPLTGAVVKLVDQNGVLRA